MSMYPEVILSRVYEMMFSNELSGNEMQRQENVTTKTFYWGTEKMKPSNCKLF